MERNLEQMVAEHRRRVEEHFNAPEHPRIPTMDRKVVIMADIPGWQPRGWYQERGVENLPPTTFAQQADAIGECVRAGAAVIHTHPRDPKTGLVAPISPPSALPHYVECLVEVTDRALEQADFVTVPAAWAWDPSESLALDYITLARSLLEAGNARGIGNRYIQVGIIGTIPAFSESKPIHTIEGIQEGTKYMEDNGIKPMFAVHSFALPMVKQYLLDAGIAKSKPYWIAIEEGKNFNDRISVDPWTYLQVIASIGLVRDALGEDAFVAINPAGRNWLAATTVALLHGVEMVRVGIEDLFYLYPHRDDISQRASDSTELVARLIRALGREIATPEEARERIGVKLT